MQMDVNEGRTDHEEAELDALCLAALANVEAAQAAALLASRAAPPPPPPPRPRPYVTASSAGPLLGWSKFVNPDNVFVEVLANMRQGDGTQPPWATVVQEMRAARWEALQKNANARRDADAMRAYQDGLLASLAGAQVVPDDDGDDDVLEVFSQTPEGGAGAVDVAKPAAREDVMDLTEEEGAGAQAVPAPAERVAEEGAKLHVAVAAAHTAIANAARQASASSDAAITATAVEGGLAKARAALEGAGASDSLLAAVESHGRKTIMTERGKARESRILDSYERRHGVKLLLREHGAPAGGSWLQGEVRQYRSPSGFDVRGRIDAYDPVRNAIIEVKVRAGARPLRHSREWVKCDVLQLMSYLAVYRCVYPGVKGVLLENFSDGSEDGDDVESEVLDDPKEWSALDAALKTVLVDRLATLTRQDVQALVDAEEKVHSREIWSEEAQVEQAVFQSILHSLGGGRAFSFPGAGAGAGVNSEARDPDLELALALSMEQR
jgi:hypothetical protein